jgi:hypothetical protein
MPVCQTHADDRIRDARKCSTRRRMNTSLSDEMCSLDCMQQRDNDFSYNSVKSRPALSTSRLHHVPETEDTQNSTHRDLQATVDK